MNRLFTFGCSFTQYTWPTWADIINYNSNYTEYLNWAYPGAGNLGIFHSIVECNVAHCISKNDTVFVMWSEPFRDDEYIDKKWHTTGRLTTSTFDRRGKILYTLNFIHAAKQLLNNTGCNWKFMSMNSIGKPGDATFQDDADDILKMHKDTLDSVLPSAMKVLFNNKIIDGRDMHPSPAEHLQYIKSVMPEIQIYKQTEDWISSGCPGWDSNSVTRW